MTITLYVLNYGHMTMAHTGRDQSLNGLVAAEIRAWMGRRELNQAEVARRLGENEMWVYRRIRGKQLITIADLHRIARALDVGVHDLMPPPDVAATAAEPTSGHPTMFFADLLASDPPDLRVDNRPPGRRDSSRPNGVRRTARVVRGGRPNAA